MTFDEPWQAQAFALAVTLQDRGVISEAEWSQALGAEIAAAPDAPYYDCWLAALERLVGSLSDPGTLERYPPRVGARRGADAARHADRAHARRLLIRPRSSSSISTPASAVSPRCAR